MLESEGRRILEGLAEIDGLKSVSRGWQEGEARLPCAVVQMTGERAAAYSDDAEYLTEVTACVRLYAQDAGELERLCGPVRKKMEEMKYRRDFAWEDGSGHSLGLVERYKTWVTNNGKDEDE